jgi:hypothetical protein
MEPQQTGDTHSYKGWLNSDSFFKRAFAIFGYNAVATLIIQIPLMLIAFVIMGTMLFGVLSNMPQGAVQNTPQEYMQENEGVPGASGKININAVCQNALAYMTFTSSEEANTFVAECVAGEHPDVIEQYKASLQLDGAQI